jgi:hypothetical protein
MTDDKSKEDEAKGGGDGGGDDGDANLLVTKEI